MINEKQSNLNAQIEKIYRFYNRGDDSGVYAVLREIRKVDPEFQSEPKINLVECAITRPWNPKALKFCEEAERAIQEKHYIKGINQAQKAMQVSPFFSRAYFLIGYSNLLQKDLENSLLNLYKALAIDRKYPNAFYNLARVYALKGDKVEMLSSLEKAIAWSEKWQDYSNQSLSDEHFSAYWKDADFNSLCDNLPVEPALRKLYQFVQKGFAIEAFEFGEELRTNTTDELAVIDAILSAIRLIVKDLNEHPENASLYNEQPLSFWKEKHVELGNNHKNLIDLGRRSDVFTRFSLKPSRGPEKLFIVSNELAIEILKENEK